jgi:hypothetical protein
MFVAHCSGNRCFNAFGQEVGDGDNRGWKSTAGLVEGTDAGAMACLDRGMAGLDPRRLRLHDLPVADAADLAEFSCTAGRCDGGVGADPVDAIGRRHGLGLGGRSNGPQEAADDLDRLVFGRQPARRAGAELRAVVPVPRAAGHRHGRRMAGRCGIGHGTVADPLARLHVRGAARVVGTWGPVIGPRLWLALQLDRLARSIDHRGVAGLGDPIRAPLRQGAGGVAGKPPAAARREARGQGPAVQHLQARHPRQHGDRLLVDGQQLR